MSPTASQEHTKAQREEAGGFWAVSCSRELSGGQWGGGEAWAPLWAQLKAIEL